MSRLRNAVMQGRRISSVSVFLVVFLSLFITNTSTPDLAVTSVDRNRLGKGSGTIDPETVAKEDTSSQHRNDKDFPAKKESGTKKTSTYDGESPAYLTARDEYKDDEILVKFKRKVPHATINSVHGKLGAKVKKTFKKTRIQVIEISHGKSLREVIEYYKKNPHVEYAEPNYKVKINSTTPNDPKFSNLWGLHNTGQTGGNEDADVDAPEAWDLFTGDSHIVVGVIDTGVDYTHEDLHGNMWVNPGETVNGIDDDGNGYIDDMYGINAVANSGDPMDDHSHGTHVSGTIGAAGNNDVGVVGVNWHVKIMALKFLSADGWGYTDGAIECIEYALAMKDKGVNITVTNNSWGGGGYSMSLYNAIKALRNAGILFIAAAGNSSSDNDESPSYPSSYNLDNIISVAATDRNDKLASFSNYGASSVDIAAPGVSIVSTIPFTNGALQIDTGTYKTMYFSFGFEGIDTSASRNNVMGAVLNWLGADTTASILLVDDDGGSGNGGSLGDIESYYQNALHALGYTNVMVHTVGIDKDGPAYSDMAGKVVIWFHGMSSNTLTSHDQTNLATFLDNGGKLFLTGQDVGYEIRSTPFYQDYLHAQYKVDSSGSSLEGVSGTLFNGYSFNIYGGDGAGNQWWPDGVVPADSKATPVLTYSPYRYYSGTSMATPHVTGLAALVWGYRPGISSLDVEDILLTSVDHISGLRENTLTGGRINAYKALQQDPSQIPPVVTSISPVQGPPETVITLKGRRFGATRGTVNFYPNEPAPITSWTDTRITCAVPAAAKSGNVTITTADGETVAIYFITGNFLDLHAFIPNPVYRAATAAVHGKIYVMGGYDNTFYETGIVRIYDTGRNYWTTGTDKPTPVANACASAIDGKIYVAGGFQASTDTPTALDILEIYDPSTDTWTTGAPLPKSLSGPEATSLNGKLYVMGGHDSSETPSPDLYEYDPVGNTWTKRASMNQARSYFATGVIDGKLYIFGGYSGIDFLSSTEVYDPSTNTWTPVASLNTPRYDLGGVSADGKLYAFGGNSFSFWSGHRKDMEVYDPILNKWEVNDCLLNKSRQGLKGTTVGNHSFFAIGGYNSSALSINESLIVDTTPPIVSFTSPSSDATGVAVNTAITAAFSEEMDSTTINTSTCILSGGVTGTVSYDSITNSVTYTPSSNLDYSTTYTAIITTGIKDSAGNAMSSVYTWNFVTQPLIVATPTPTPLLTPTPSPIPTTSVTPTPMVTATPPPDNVAALYAFDEGSGTIAGDSSGNGNNGTANGATWTTGKNGGGLSFNGVNSYVDLGNLSNLQPGKVSLSAWFKTTAASGMIMRKRGYGYGLEVVSSGKISFWIYNAAATKFMATSLNAYNDNAWHHAVGVYDGSTVKLYIDGSQVASANAGTIFYGAGGIAIGRDGDYNGLYFNGLIDEVSVYNRDLNDQEIQGLYDVNAVVSLDSLDMKKDTDNTKYNGASITGFIQKPIVLP